MSHSKTVRATPGNGLREHQLMLSAFANRPADTGAVTPSSRRLAEALVAGTGLELARTIVELGAGTGVVTRAIEARADKRATIIALELNPNLAVPLVSSFPRLRIVNECAENLPQVLSCYGARPAEVIISALPWASFPPDRMLRVLDAIQDSLKPGGHFCTAAYLHASCFPAGQRLRRELKERFGSVTTTPVVWRNLPPAFVYRCH
jgi:phosphatidylethanolamine/phosphatidyl-N-methylethanolamine N-methyltransferase